MNIGVFRANSVAKYDILLLKNSPDIFISELIEESKKREITGGISSNLTLKLSYAFLKNSEIWPIKRGDSLKNTSANL